MRSIDKVIAAAQIGALVTPVVGGIAIEIAGFTLTPDRVIGFAALFLFPYLLVAAPAQEGRYLGGWLFATWVAVLSVATLLAVDPSAHLSGYVISILPAFSYYLFARRKIPEVNVSLIVEIALWYSVIGGMVAYILWLTTGLEVLEVFIDRERIQWTSMEPNIFAAGLASLLVLHLPYYEKSARHNLLYVLAVATVFVTFSRMPYLALLVAIAVYYMCSSRAISSAAIGLIGIGSAILSVAVLLSGDAIVRLYDVMLNRTDSFSNRMKGLRLAWERWQEAPLLGRGALDFNLSSRVVLEMIGSSDANSAWIWQIGMAVLHDSGVIGAVAYSAFLLTVLGYGLGGHRDRVPISRSCAVIVLLICSLTTTLHLTVYFGALLGLVAQSRVGERLALAARTTSREQLQP